jgi:hypothetical protein
MLPAAALAIFATLALGIAGYGAGLWIGSVLPVRFSHADRVACSWLGGLGLLGVVLFLAGQAAFSLPIIIFILSAAALPVVWAAFRKMLVPEARWREVLGGLPVLPVIVLAYVLVVTAIGGLAEITGDWGHDAIAYHLLGPKVWLHEGVVRPVLDNSHTAFPVTVEMLFGALMAIGGPLAPGFSATLTMALFFAMVFSVARRVGLDGRGAWWCVAIVAAMPAVYAGGHSGFVDVLYAAFVLAAARVGLDAQRRSEYVVFGVFCGLAAGTKYTGLLAFAAILLCLAVARASKGAAERSGIGPGAMLAVVVGCGVAAPFYIRNWIQLGCPIYPPPPGLIDVYHGVCHARYFPVEAIRAFHAFIHSRGGGLGRGLGAYLLLPYNLTYHTSNFYGAGGIGLCALALAPFGVVAVWREAFSRMMVLLGWMLVSVWFVTQQESRFLIPVYALAAVFAVLGWRYGVRVSPGRLSRGLCGAAVAISIVYGCYMIGISRKDDVHAAVSGSFAEKQRLRRVPFYESFRYLNGETSVQKTLILDRCVPPYYLNGSYLKPFGQWGERPLEGIDEPAEILSRLHEFGFTHVLDVHSELSDFRAPENTPDLKLVFDRPGQRVYRVE